MFVRLSPMSVELVVPPYRMSEGPLLIRPQSPNSRIRRVRSMTNPMQLSCNVGNVRCAERGWLGIALLNGCAILAVDPFGPRDLNDVS